MLFIDGEPAADATPLDRGLEFGDGLFETMAVKEGRVRLLEQHLARLASGCVRLGIAMPDRMRLISQIAAAAATPGTEVLKLVLTRGDGGTGYAVSPAAIPRCYLVATPARRPRSPGARVVRLSTPLSEQPRLAGLKHLNRLEQVLLRQDLAALNADEGLVSDREGHLLCGVMSNVFLVLEDRVVTPSLTRSGIEGVMRAAILAALAAAGRPAEIREVGIDECAAASEIFLSNALVGVWPVIERDGSPLKPGPVANWLTEQVATW